jgi:hypothetical protein
MAETQAYIDKRKFGGDKSHAIDSDEEEKYLNDPDLDGKSPISRKLAIEEKETENIKKLGVG